MANLGSLPIDPKIPQSLRDWLDRLRLRVESPSRPLRIAVNQFSGFFRIVEANDASQNEKIQFAGTGNPVLEEINSLGIA